MKRFYFLAVLAGMMIAPLHANASEFFLKIYRFGSYKVQFADQMIITPSNTYRFFDLNPGTYTLTVSDPVSNLVYYQMNITLTTGYRTVSEIDAFGTYKNLTNFAVTYTTWYQEAPQVISSYPGTTTFPGTTTYPYPNTNTYPYPNTSTYPYPNTTTYTYPNTATYPGSVITYPGTTTTTYTVPVVTYPAAMSNSSFLTLKTLVDGQTWDSDKMATLRSTMTTNYFSAEQIYQLAVLFDWDSDRLTFAKEAYSRCVDKNNYFKVTQAFKWSSDIEALQTYISTH